MLTLLMPSIDELITQGYNDIKTSETENIIANAMKGITTSKEPLLWQVSGIPGAGKSTYCDLYKKPNFLYVSFDKIMQQLSGYQQELSCNGTTSAYKKYEMQARVIGYELLMRGVSSKLNIMLEHSGTNTAHLELFKNIKSLGYKTAVSFIVCDINTAISRAKNREKIEKRYVPEELILKRADAFNLYAQKYYQLTTNVKVYDSGNNFALLKKI